MISLLMVIQIHAENVPLKNDTFVAYTDENDNHDKKTYENESNAMVIKNGKNTANYIKSEGTDTNNQLCSEIANKCPAFGGTVQVISGKRNESDIRNKMSMIKRSLLNIYRARLKNNPSLSGTICVYFSISQDGNVENACVTETTLNDSTIEKVFIDTLINANFGRYRFAGGTTFAVSRVKFKPFDVSYAKQVLIGSTIFLFVMLDIFLLSIRPH